MKLRRLDWFINLTNNYRHPQLGSRQWSDLWTRLHVKDLEIRYRGGIYNSDFIAAENGQRWSIETKAGRDVATENVQAKRKAAEEWTNIVNADAQADAKWGYLLVSETELAAAKEDW